MVRDEVEGISRSRSRSQSCRRHAMLFRWWAKPAFGWDWVRSVSPGAAQWWCRCLHVRCVLGMGCYVPPWPPSFGHLLPGLRALEMVIAHQDDDDEARELGQSASWYPSFLGGRGGHHRIKMELHAATSRWLTNASGGEVSRLMGRTGPVWVIRAMVGPAEVVAGRGDFLQSSHPGPWHDEEQNVLCPGHAPERKLDAHHHTLFLAGFRPDMREPADQRQRSSPPPGTRL